MDAKEYEENLESLIKIADHIKRGSPPEEAVIKVLKLNEALLYFDRQTFWREFLSRYKGNLILQAIALLIKNYGLEPKRMQSLIEKLLVLAGQEKLLIMKQHEVLNRMRRQIRLLSAISAHSTGILIGLANLGCQLNKFTCFQSSLFQISLTCVFVTSFILAEVKILAHLLSNSYIATESFHLLVRKTLPPLVIFMILGFILSALLV